MVRAKLPCYGCIGRIILHLETGTWITGISQQAETHAALGKSWVIPQVQCTFPQPDETQLLHDITTPFPIQDLMLTEAILSLSNIDTFLRKYTIPKCSWVSTRFKAQLLSIGLMVTCLSGTPDSDSSLSFKVRGAEQCCPLTNWCDAPNQNPSKHLVEFAQYFLLV